VGARRRKDGAHVRGIRKKSGSDIFVVLNDEFGLKNEQNGAFWELGRGYLL
jgi:hypothetical protein